MAPYLDYNASAPQRPEVREAMLRFDSRPRGNASSLHSLGQEGLRAVAEARETVARLVGAPSPDTIVFTSGATESDVWALRGVVDLEPGAERRGLVVSAVEHPAVLSTADALARRGVPVRHIPVEPDGQLGALGLGDRDRLVSVMAANNETGVVWDLEAVVAEARPRGVLVHTDAAQAAGRIRVDVAGWGVDLCSVSAHKLGGPTGVGALYIGPGIDLPPLLPGGGQQGGRRGGTLHVAGIVGFGAAAQVALTERESEAARIRSLRDRFEEQVTARLQGVRVVAAAAHRLPNTSMLAVRGVKGEAVVFSLDAEGISISTGAACSSGSGEPSHVLTAMGLVDEELDGAVRFSLGHASTERDVDQAAEALVRCVERLRAIAGGTLDV